MSRPLPRRDEVLRPANAPAATARRLLVTGGSGFLGREVGGRLARDGLFVRASVRGDCRLAYGVEPAIVPDLQDGASLRRAMEGIDAVVHLAGLAHVFEPTVAADDGAFRRVNVEGTRAVLQAARAAGIGRFIFISSVAAASGGVVRLSSASHGDPEGAYGRSKREAERLVSSFAEEDGASAVILRPAMTYGPGMKGNPLRLFRWVDRGLPVPVGQPANRRSLLFSGNMAAAIAAVLRSPDVTGTYYVADAETLSTEQLVRTIARALGRSGRVLRLPVGLLSAAGRVGDVVRAVVPWPLDSTVVRRLVGSCEVDSRELTEATSTTLPFTVAEGIRQTAVWFRGSACR